MAKKLYDLAVKTGSYNDAQGNEKGRWQNVGSVMQNDEGGKFIMLARWFSPAGVPDLSGKGGDSILLSMFEPKQQDGQQGGGQRQAAPQRAAAPAAQRAPARQQSQDLDDDIPF